MPVDCQILCAIGKSERDLRETDRLARVGAVKNNISHLVAAERLGGLLPEHPTDRIEHIGLSATVWPDNSGDALVEIENRFIGKRFEAEELDRL